MQELWHTRAANGVVLQVYDTDGTTVLHWQAFTYDSQGRTLTEQVIDPSDGTTVMQEVERTYYNSGDEDGLLHTITQTDIGGSDDVTTRQRRWSLLCWRLISMASESCGKKNLTPEKSANL